MRNDEQGTVEAMEPSRLTLEQAEEYGALLSALVGFGSAGEEGTSVGQPWVPRSLPTAASR